MGQPSFDTDWLLNQGVKELMGRIQERRREQVEETAKEACEGGDGEEEEESSKDENAGENLGEGRAGGDVVDEDELYKGGEAQDTEGEDKEGAIVPVDPALEEVEDLLNFDLWKEMLREISIMFVPDAPCHSPTPEKDIPQPEDSVSLLKEAPSPSSTPIGAPVDTAAPCQPLLSSFLPGFQQPPLFGSFPSIPVGVQFAHRWTSHPRQGHGTFQGRRGPRGQRSGPRRGQGRGSYPSTQIPQPSEGNALLQNLWRPPRNEPPKPREARGSWRGGRGGWSSKQKAQSSADQSGRGSVKEEAHASGQAGSGQGSAKRPPTPNKGGEASGNKGSQNRHHGGRGRGRGAGSAKGPQNK